MIEAFSTPLNSTRTFIFLGICGLLALAAAVVGIDDNPPGILLGFLATIAFFLTFVHPWRKARQFLRLLYASIAGLIVFGALNIGVDLLLTTNQEISGLLISLLSGLGVIFLTIVLLCPAGLLVGAVGAVVMAIRSHRHNAPG